MSDYLVYWGIDDVRDVDKTDGWRHACWGSRVRNFDSRFNEGDRIYFTTIDEGGHHYLFSKMVLDFFSGSKSKTEPMLPFSLSETPFESFWMGKKPWGDTFRIPFRSLAMTLEFASGKALPQGFTGQNLQAIRKLTSSDSASIERLMAVNTA